MTAVAGAAGGGRGKTRLGAAFAKMTTSCPGEVRAYGACISSNLDKALERGVCEKEFQALRGCFAKAVKELRKK